ncbi:MAG: hypothetical protein COU11_00450 [Candidatus Harrisonbacteria bacterium CG10_big_fil_rev_8_21_14_0_10_49_15]|uniref:site-specific DNA-methyltransferase (adenine-specific) n=1 Tax=Candidatus Harrisonbacteria bacterium CG10_big_fil_rev_8_21_14_0_10_49_15 TaxID=1974587 RepID=A0A2H0UM32_9BACT|nr:MAG: hypothetical protein COU11_00450 [Candidatus Harrisonbacteria bacterium CG10_big_fil_rev_8_21_14_0_10_49_15]
MSTIEIKKRLDPLLRQLSTERSLDVAEKIIAELVGLLDIKVGDRFLVNIPRVDAELSRFQLAPGFARQAAAYELPHEDSKPIDLKLFWVKKASKTNLSWLIGLTPNFEDALSNDYKNIGIDFVVPEACDSITVLLSNRFKVRALELKDHITPTQLEIFAQWAKLSEMEIADQNESKNNLHAKLWESFNFEPINRKFYLELVEHFSILVHHLEKNLGRKPAVMFTTRLIGRLLFTWFLKKKNLVNNDSDYFFVSDPGKQGEYYKSQLEKLFFEILNRDELERSNGDRITPYLNGGLFDISTTDFYGDPKLTFPNGYFNQLFNTLNKYNFTVDESSPEFQHVAIDPEMLGRIFESLLAEQIDENTGNSKKKATGAFYTPRDIVSYMCEQSLIEYLKTKISDSPDRDRRIDELVRMPEAIFRDQDQNKRRDWKPYRDSIIKALEGSKTESPLTVLDPAVGSGAFPMGMLHLLVKVYSRLDPKFEKDISKLKRDILSRSLYGVDIEQTAIEITRLRAWLSIIVDIPEGEKVEPLPNLEFKFVCANTLIPLNNTEQATFFTDHSLKDKLIKIRDDYFRTSSKTKKEKLQKDYLKLTQSASLFDNKKTQQLKSYKPFDISSSSEFYDPELMHGVSAFDIVIGNPPYVRADNPAMKEQRKLIMESKTYQTLYEKWDLYVAFIEKGYNLLNQNGIIEFIIPDAYMASKYAIKSHNYFLQNSIISRINFLNEIKVFEAAVKNIIIEYRKGINSDNIPLKIKHTPTFENFIMLPSKSQKQIGEFAFKINNENKSIGNLVNSIKWGEICYVSVGLVLQSEEKLYKGEFIKEDLISNEQDKIHNKEYVEAKWINKYCVKKNKYLEWNTQRVPAKIRRPTFPELYTPEKIMMGGMTGAVIDGKGLLCNHSIDVSVLWISLKDVNNRSITSSIQKDFKIKETTEFRKKLEDNSSKFGLKYLLAILNSKFANYFLNQVRRSQIGFYPDDLKKLPIKNIALSGQQIFIDLVDQILTLKKQNKEADTKNLEAQIDQLVYKLYGLTEDEIGIVEAS